MKKEEMPLMEKSLKTTLSMDHHDHHGNQCYNVVTDSIILILGILEIAFVIYLSVQHFLHSMGVIAIAMLAPILLNFVGVTYFLSNHEERKVFERSSGTSRCAKDLFQVPVLGPIFTSVKILMLSAGQSKQGADYHRFEASAIKMRQAESFFGCAPEALVQLTVLLTTAEGCLKLDNYLEILVVVLSVIILSEANMYALMSNYYRLFHKYNPDEWKIPTLHIWQKSILFLHSFFSIGSRIAAMACLKAAVKFYVVTEFPSTPTSDEIPLTTPKPIDLGVSCPPKTYGAKEAEEVNRLGYYIACFFLIEIGFRMMFYYIVRLCKYWYKGEGIPSGCYESISYGWRATILDLGYQSKNIAVQIWFYLENSICFIIWWGAIAQIGDSRPLVKKLRDNLLLPLTSIFVLFTLVSVFLLFACAGLKLHTLRSPFKKNREQN